MQTQHSHKSTTKTNQTQFSNRKTTAIFSVSILLIALYLGLGFLCGGIITAADPKFVLSPIFPPIDTQIQSKDSDKQLAKQFIFEYDPLTKEYSITGCHDHKSTSLTIPSKYRGRSVTNLAYNAFSGFKNIQEIKFQPNCAINSIGANCFSDCSALQTISLPATIQTINENAFANTGLKTITIGLLSNLKTIGNNAFKNTKIQSIVLPQNLTSIGEYAFSDCTSLSSISSGKNLQQAGDFCFNNTAITNLKLTGLTQITPNTFAGMSNLTKLNISETSITTIPAHAFENSSLTELTLSPLVKTIEDYAFYNSNLITIEIYGDDGDGNFSFMGVSGGIVFFVNEVGDYAFANTKIRAVEWGGELLDKIPESWNYSLVKIGEKSFYGCNNLTNVTLPNNERLADQCSIGSLAFANNPKLKDFDIGYNQSGDAWDSSYFYQININPNIFENCPNLKKIFTYNNTKLLISAGVESLIDDNTGYDLERDISYEKAIEGIITADQITEIHFSEGSKISRIVAISADKGTFEGLTELASIHFASNTQPPEISNNAFNNCPNLKAIWIVGCDISEWQQAQNWSQLSELLCDGTAGTTGLEYEIFTVDQEGSAITNILVGTKGARITNYTGNSLQVYINPYIIYEGEVYPVMIVSGFKNKGITSCQLPHTLVSINDYAFYSTKLTSIKIPDSVLIIYNSAFSGCSSLSSVEISPNSKLQELKTSAFFATRITSIFIPKSTTKIESSAFWGCTQIESITVDSANTTYMSRTNCLIDKSYASYSTYAIIKGCNNSQIPSLGLLEIGQNAFAGCTFSTINLSDNVVTIAKNAFSNCKNLESITFSTNTKLSKILSYAFYNCTKLTLQKLPKTLYEIGEYAFSGTAVQTLEFESNSNPITIGQEAFSNCSSLTSISFSGLQSSSVTINEKAFLNCSSLTEITYLSNAKTIRDYAFADCDNLTTVSLGLANVPRITTTIFSGSTNNLTIKIPAAYKSNFETDEFWKYYKHYFE